MPAWIGSRKLRRAGTPGYERLGPSFLPTYAAKLALCKNGIARVRVFCVGESNMRASGAGTGPAENVGAEAFAVPKKLVDYLKAAGLPALHGGIFGGGFGAGGSDSRLVYGTGWSNNGTNSLGGACYANTTDINTSLAFTPVDAFDRIVIWYIRGVGRGTLVYNVDGGATLNTQAMAGGTALLSTIASCSLGIHTLNIQLSVLGAGVQIVGIETYNSLLPQINVFNCGWSGADISTIGSTQNSISSANALATVQPDLTIACEAANDIEGGTPELTFKTSFQTLAGKARTTGDIIFAPSMPFFADLGGEPARNLYGSWVRDVARTNSNTFVDLTQLMGTYAAAAAAGLMSISSANHMNAAGYDQAARFLVRPMIF